MPPIPLMHAPQNYRTLCTWTLDSFDELTHLRADLTQALTPHGQTLSPAAAEVAQGMVLVSSELATNALKHARPPTTITLSTDDRNYLLDVADTAPAAIPALATDRAPGEGGFGLVLAKKLAQAIGWYITGRTKHVWAEFPIRPT